MHRVFEAARPPPLTFPPCSRPSSWVVLLFMMDLLRRSAEPISLDPHFVSDRITTQNAATVAGMKHDSLKDNATPLNRGPAPSS